MPLFLLVLVTWKEEKGEKGGKRISLEESVVETREGLATMTLSTMRDEEELPVVF